MGSLLGHLWWRLSLAEWRLHPWRQAVGLMAIVLGVALAFSVQLINHSALEEFGSAVRQATQSIDATVRCPVGGCDDRLWDALAVDPEVVAVGPMVAWDGYARSAGSSRKPLRIWGLDALSSAVLRPLWLPVAQDSQDRWAGLHPDRLFLNAAALQQWGVQGGDVLEVQVGDRWHRLAIAGTVAAGGAPAAVLDIAGAQSLLGETGRLSALELRLAPGATLARAQERWQSLAIDGERLWPSGTQVALPEDDGQKLSLASRAYRVNLTVLALVALFVGGFLVFSVQSLSVAQRTPTLALLGVLGLSARQRLWWVHLESLIVGSVGSALGLALGALAAWAALQWLAGDLGGGYFPGIAPTLRWSWPSAIAFFALGTAAACLGGWLPARAAQALSCAQALKGLGTAGTATLHPRTPALLLGLAGLLALLPPIAELPLAAYGSVALLLAGGIAAVPALLAGLLSRWRPSDHPLAVLARERALHERRSATVAVAGVVASLSLSVALSIMVASFRTGVSDWLDAVLPADLYMRTAAQTAAADSAYLEPDWVEAVAKLPGVRQVEASRLRSLNVDPRRPAVALVARPLDGAELPLPLVEPALPRPALRSAVGTAGSTPVDAKPGTEHAPMPVSVSEAVSALYGVQQGDRWVLPLPTAAAPQGMVVRVHGVWRDYARQFGAIAIDLGAYRAATGDQRVNDLALRLAPGASAAAVQEAARALARDPELLEFAVPADIRALSLRIFDRSFAVTYYLQALAIGIGLFGIAASFSAQVWARRKEFGLLQHLGLSRRAVVTVVAAEGAAWTAAGAVAGLLLGTVVSAVLVFVVNPQSFHWTMPLEVPLLRLGVLALCVWCAGTLTSAWSARAAASVQAVRAVKEDW